MKAIVLLSGGIDSTTTLAIAIEAGLECIALTFDYGQSHGHETQCAEAIARRYEIEHRVIVLDRFAAGASSLTGGVSVPRHDALEPGIPSTYVPARNTIFLAYALAYAEVYVARSIWIGANVLDYSGYPDCRPEFIEAFQRVATLGTRAGVEGSGIEIKAPLLAMSKADIITRGRQLGIDYSMTLTCYQPCIIVSGWAHRGCGVCDACHIRRSAFTTLGLIDPIEYER